MNRIIGLVLALVVGGLLVGGLLIPSIEGMTATEKTFENEGLYYLNKYSDSDTIPEITWHVETPYKITVGEAVIDLPSSSTFNPSIVLCDNCFMRFAPLANPIMQIYGAEASGARLTVSSTGEDDLIISFESGTVTFTCGDSNYSTTYTEIYCIAAEGSYIMKNASETAYILEDSPIYDCGRTDLYNLSIEGTIKDGITVSTIYPPAGVTSGEVTINATAESNYKNLYKFSSLEFTLTDTDQNTTTDAVYSQVIVPAKITAELSQHMTPTEIAMFGVISILGIVALVVVAANGIRNKY